MPPVPVTRSSTNFLATATSTQQVIFYIGLGISIAIAIASIAFLTVWVRRLWTGTCPKFFYGWRDCSQGTRAINLPIASKSHSIPESVEATPHWALAYQKHFEAAQSASSTLSVSPYGMPMLRTPKELRGLGMKMEELPVVSSTSTKADSEQDIAESSHLSEGPAEVPLIVVEDDDEFERSLRQTILFPVFPVLSAEKSVIDYLQVPPRLWHSPELGTDDSADSDSNRASNTELNLAVEVDPAPPNVRSKLAITPSFAAKRQGFYGTPMDWEGNSTVHPSTVHL